MLGANLRFRAGRSPVEFALGGGMAITRTARRDNVSTPTLPAGPPSSFRDTTSSTREPAVSGALSFAARVSPRVTIVPAIGACWIRRSMDSEPWNFGMGRYMVTFGATVRVGS